MGVLDCEWCQLQADGKTPLSKQYCASQRVCFGGVLGAATPYGDEISGKIVILFNSLLYLFLINMYLCMYVCVHMLMLWFQLNI